MKIKPKQEHTCEECKLKWQDTKPINTDIKGKPFGYRCPHSQWLILKTYKACKHIKL